MYSSKIQSKKYVYLYQISSFVAVVSRENSNLGDLNQGQIPAYFLVFNALKLFVMFVIASSTGSLSIELAP